MTTFAGFHEYPAGAEADWFVVFRSGDQWYWQEYASDKKTPRGMVRGPFPTDEGAYLSAIGD